MERYAYRFTAREVSRNGWPLLTQKRCAHCRRSTRRVPYGVSICIKERPRPQRHYCVYCTFWALEMIRAEVKKVYSKTLKYLNQVSMEADLIRMHKHSERIQYLLDQQERRKNELSD